MSIASRITAMQEHIEDDYEVLETAGADLTNVDKNIINLKQTWKERLLYFINNGVEDVWNNWEKVTGTGSSMTLNNTTEAPMSLTYNGNIYQYTTTGKNLCSGITEQDTYICPCSVGDKFTLSLVGRGGGSDKRIFLRTYNGEFTPTLDARVDQVVINLTSTDASYTATITSTTDGFVYIRTGAGPSSYSLSKVQVERGATVTDFEPYTNGVSPNPDYPQNVEVVTGRQTINICSENLFDGELETGAYNTSTGAKQSDNNMKRNVNPIYVDGNKTYIISNNGSGVAVNVLQYKSDGTFIQYNTISSGNSFTTTSNTAYINIYRGSSNTDKLQIEKGSTITSYKVYKGQSYEINLGKNLFDKDNANILIAYFDNNTTSITSSDNNRTLYIKCDPNTTYTFQKIPSTIVRHIGYTKTKPEIGTQVYDITPMTANSGVATITTENDAEYLVFRFYQEAQDSSYTLQQMLDSIQIEVGSQASSYSPYKTPIELCKIGDYKDFIRKGTGKNLLDGVFRQGNHVNLSTSNRICSVIEIKSKTGKKYTLSTNLPNTFKYKIMNCTTNNLDTTVINDTSYTSSGSVSVYCGSDGYLKILVGKTDDGNLTPSDISSYNFQVEEGNSSSSFEPYGFKDKWYSYKAIGKVVLDGSENWETQWSNTNKKGYRLTISNIKQISDLTAKLGLYSNNYTEYSQSVLSDETISYGISTRVNNSQIIIGNNSTATLNDFKTWLSTHNTTVYYPLATPTTTEITDTELVSQLEEIKKSYNNITNINVDGILPTQLDVVALKM